MANARGVASPEQARCECPQTRPVVGHGGCAVQTVSVPRGLRKLLTSTSGRLLTEGASSGGGSLDITPLCNRKSQWLNPSDPWCLSGTSTKGPMSPSVIQGWSRAYTEVDAGQARQARARDGACHVGGY